MSKTFPFQTNQFSIQKQFHFKLLSLASVRSLNAKTVLFQAIQFIKYTQFSSILPIHRTLSRISTPGQSGPGRDGNKEVLCIPKAPALLEPHHQIV